MRKVLIALATAGAALAVASPASAQYYGGGYNNYAYGNRGQMQNELQQIRYQADNLNRQGRLTRSEARDLYNDLASAERSLYRGGNPWQLNQKIQQIRYELRRYSDDDRRGNRYGNYGYNNYNSYNNGYYDRDRDGRDDRYEDDHGYRRDR